MIEAPARRCETCAFWSAHGAQIASAGRAGAPRSGVGTCQRNPPMLVQIQSQDWPVSVFPEINADRFCGAWQPAGGAPGGERNPTPQLRAVA